MEHRNFNKPSYPRPRFQYLTSEPSLTQYQEAKLQLPDIKQWSDRPTCIKYLIVKDTSLLM